MKFFNHALAVFVICLTTNGAIAQGAQVAFGGLQHDSTLPIEMSANELTINQQDGTAIFRGNVLIGQGEMRLSAADVRVEYAAVDGQVTGEISRLVAGGGVTLVSGAEAAEAERAEYSVETGVIIMSGSVLLTQGANALSSERMVIDLGTGSAVLQGRVRTIIQSGGN